MRVELETLANFLVEAKKNAWAGNAEEKNEFGIRKVAPFTKNYSKKYILIYMDQYVGGKSFQGLEVVSQILLDEFIPVWAMSYGGNYLGSLKEKKKVDQILKSALKKAPIDAPFRGPSKLSNKIYEYENNWHGTLKDFKGEEIIYDKKTRYDVFGTKYAGGLIRQ